jgi:hypothetical protein
VAPSADDTPGTMRLFKEENNTRAEQEKKGEQKEKKI